MKKIIFAFGVVCLAILTAPKVLAADLSAGDLIKASLSTVYYYGSDGKRYVFPNEAAYKTWYADFSAVKTITDAELASVSIAANVTYKAGVKMVKIQTDPKVYAVAKNGVLRWVKTEAVAEALYGADWNKKIDDIPDAFFVNYTLGSDIASAADFDAAAEKAADTIEKTASATSPSIVPVAKTYIWNLKDANEDAYYHHNLEFSEGKSGFMATWYDDRNGQNEIFYQDIGTDGAGIGDANKVSNNITDSTNGKGVYDGVNTYIFWEDGSALKRAIYSQKYDANGNKVKLSLFASTTYATSRYPDAAWNEALGKYGVAWWDTKTGGDGLGDLYFSLMTQDGLKSGAELKVTPASGAEFRPRIIAADDKFAAVWQGADNIVKFALIDGNGALSGTVKELYTGNLSDRPRLAWTGSQFGLVWTDVTEGNRNVYFMQLDKDGNAIGGKIALTSGAGDALEPSILWSGSEFYVAYTNYKPSSEGAVSDIRIIKLNSSGAVNEAAKSISSAGIASYAPVLAKNGGAIAAVWLEGAGTANKIMAAVEMAQ